MLADALNNLFTTRSMELMIEGKLCEPFEEAFESITTSSSGKSFNNRVALSSIYHYLSKCYRNEYFYKNTLLQKLVYGIHSPRTSIALCELPVASSIADFVLINGHAIVYEIKTELDNLSRLETQIEDYYKAFRFVCIVCHEKLTSKLLEQYQNAPVGIYALTQRSCLSKRKEACENTTLLDPWVQFSMLRKKERDSILLAAGLQLPNTNQIQYYRASYALFESIPCSQRSHLFEMVLKSRKKSLNLEAVEAFPPELRLLAYLNNVNRNDACSINEFLNAPYKV